MAGERKPPVDLLGRIAAFLEDRPAGAPAEEIAARFLHMVELRPAMAESVVASLLERDPRFRRGPGRLWRGAPSGGEGGGERNDAVARVYGAARPSASVPGAFRIGLVRFEGERETGRAVFVTHRRSGAPPPEDGARLLRDARLVIWSVAAPFASLRDAGGSNPVRLRTRAAPFAPDEARRSPDRLARHLGAEVVEGENDPLLDARLLRTLDLRLREREAAAGGPADAPADDIPFLREGGEEYLHALPDSPGIYRMRDDEGRVLYIGKSRSLRSRVESYFRSYSSLAGPKREMVRRIKEIEVMILGSEAEALLEEWRHIRRRRPPYNEKVEVIGDPARRTAGRNLVIFLPSTDEKSVTLFLLRADESMRRVRARRNPKKTDRLARDLKEFFGGMGGEMEPGAYVLLSRWLEENRDRVTYLDADRAGDPDDLLRIVVECLRDPEITSGARLDRR
ncbi:MAG: nucleotide excision repair endonuclease [Candidatus Eisenbacteria bacterium]